MAAAPIRRRVPFFQLGAPAPYVYGALLGTLFWLPVRVYEERHGSLLLAVVRAGLAGRRSWITCRPPAGGRCSALSSAPSCSAY